MDDLVRSGAPIDTYAVGTRVDVSAGAPFMDSAYKMVEYDGRPVMKLSSAKVTAPGPKQVFRCPGYAHVVGLADEQPPDDGRPLLETVLRGGRRTGDRPTLDECRTRFAADLRELPPTARRIREPDTPQATVSEKSSAASRAMNDLAQQLLRVAERDIEDVGASRPDTRQPAEWPM